MWIVSFLIILVTRIDANFLYEGSDCMFKNQRGSCISFDECQSVKQDVMSRAIGFSEVVHCASKGGISLICCPSIISDRAQDDGSTSTLRTTSVSKSESACRKYSDPNTIGAPIDFQILEGVPTAPGEFPHMAALGYNQINGLGWLCGGSLISEQYVLTAAHCVAGSNKPTVVRFGKTSLLDEADGGEALDISVDSITLHPQYRGNQSAFDIALIKLSKTVEINSFVRPACLHTATQELSSSQELVATGWGVTNATTFSKSDVLLKVNLTLLNIDTCNQTYIQLAERKLKALNGGHLCTAPGKRDTCDGDSGGPLQIVSNIGVSTVVGVTSSGISCGSTFIPGIYTKVAFFVDWIDGIVWP